jgi:hypothetical protein
MLVGLGESVAQLAATINAVQVWRSGVRQWWSTCRPTVVHTISAAPWCMHLQALL